MSCKPWLYSLPVFILALSACATPAPTATPPIASVSATAAVARTPTQTQPANMPCLLMRGEATPEALGAQFESRGHITGPAGAAVTLVEFSDYQCPVCAFLEASLRQIRQTHPNDVRFIFITTPVATQDKDLLAMQAAEAADLQNKFWEMHDLLFDKLKDWSALAPADFEAWATRQAEALGLDRVKFQTDFGGSVVAGRLQQATQAASKQPITPPLLFVNSVTSYTGYVDFPSLDTVVRMEALKARQFNACPKWVIDPARQYIANLHTSKGDVAIELYADKAPLAVNNFVFLAKAGWYNGITFYRVVPNSIAQTGDPSETGMGNPGYLFETELPTGLNFNRAGMVAMDNSGMNTNGSRFLITLASAPQMEGQYTIIGQVLSGLDVLKALSPRDPTPGVVLPAGDELIRVDIEER